MPNGKVKEVVVLLDRERRIRLDFNALAIAEDLTGKNLLDSDAWKGLKAGELRAVLYACLKHEDPHLTPEAVGAMIHPGNIGEIIAALNEAYAEAMPEASATEGAEQAESPLPAGA